MQARAAARLIYTQIIHHPLGAIFCLEPIFFLKHAHTLNEKLVVGLLGEEKKPRRGISTSYTDASLGVYVLTVLHTIHTLQCTQLASLPPSCVRTAVAEENRDAEIRSREGGVCLYLVAPRITFFIKSLGGNGKIVCG